MGGCLDVCLCGVWKCMSMMRKFKCAFIPKLFLYAVRTFILCYKKQICTNSTATCILIFNYICIYLKNLLKDKIYVYYHNIFAENNLRVFSSLCFWKFKLDI